VADFRASLVRGNAGASGIQVASDAFVAVVSRFRGRCSCPRGRSRNAARRRARHDLKPEDVTFVVLTKNEERRLPIALASIPRGSPALVLDAESSDGTVTAARAAGATVIVLPWEGFVAARRFAA